MSREFGPSPYGPRAGFAAHRTRAPFLRRDPENVHALAGGGVLRRCSGCAAHVLELGSFSPCPECGELPQDDHDDEGLIQLRAALDERVRAGGVDPGPWRGEP